MPVLSPLHHLFNAEQCQTFYVATVVKLFVGTFLRIETSVFPHGVCWRLLDTVGRSRPKRPSIRVGGRAAQHLIPYAPWSAERSTGVSGPPYITVRLANPV